MWLRLVPIVGVLSGINQELYRKLSRWVLRRGGITINGLPLWISPRVFFDVSTPGSIQIGDRSVVSHYVRILTHDFSLDRVAERMNHDANHEYELYRSAPVVIGNQAFIGMGATVMPGVTIGDGAIVATNALVTKDVAADTVVAGVPARLVSSTSAYMEKRRGDFVTRRRRA